jgi:hypothetical protein
VSEEPVDPPGPRARVRAPRGRVGSFPVFVLAFLLLAGAAAGAAWGQFQPGKTGPWVSLTCSAGAVVLTLVALSLRPKR